MKKTIWIFGIAILLLIVAICGCMGDEKERKTKTYSGTEEIGSSGLSYCLVIGDEVENGEIQKGDTITWEWTSDCDADFSIGETNYKSATDEDSGSFIDDGTGSYTFEWDIDAYDESEMWAETYELRYTIKVIPK